MSAYRQSCKEHLSLTLNAIYFLDGQLNGQPARYSNNKLKSLTARYLTLNGRLNGKLNCHSAWYFTFNAELYQKKQHVCLPRIQFFILYSANRANWGIEYKSVIETASKGSGRGRARRGRSEVGAGRDRGGSGGAGGGRARWGLYLDVSSILCD